jgi:hypothetical protein
MLYSYIEQDALQSLVDASLQSRAVESCVIAMCKSFESV